jgi:ferredoxin
VSASWAVEPDWERCIGSGSCAFTAPEVFDVDDSGAVQLVGPVIAGDPLVQLAVENCPTGALRLIQGGGA